MEPSQWGRSRDGARPPGSGSAPANSQRQPRVVSIRPEHARAAPASGRCPQRLRATQPANPPRWSSSGRARGTSVAAAMEPSQWGRSRDGARPPGSGSAGADPQRRLGVVSIRPEHAPSSRLRATRPAMSPAGRVAATASASELVAAYRDHPATAQREPAPSVGLEWSRPPPAPSSRRRLLDQRVVRHRSGVRGRRRSASRGGGRRGGRPARGRRRSRTRCARSATAGSPTGAARPTCG